MSSDITLESVNAKIDLGSKSSKLFSLKTENNSEFRSLVSEKKENKKNPTEQNVAPKQAQKQDKHIEITNRAKIQQEFPNQFKSGTELNEESAGLSELDQAEDVSEVVVQDEQQTMETQLLHFDYMPQKVEELSLVGIKQIDEDEKNNIPLENDFKLSNAITSASLNDEPSQQLVMLSSKNASKLNDIEIDTDVIEESIDEVIVDESNAQFVIPSNAVNKVSLNENLTTQVPIQVYSQDQFIDDVNVLKSEMGDTEFEGNEALLAKLSNQNFKNEINAVQEQFKANPVIVLETDQGSVEVAVKHESMIPIDHSDNSLDKIKIVKLAIDNNINSMFADNSKAGQEILRAMRTENKKDISELTDEELVAAALLSDFSEEVEISSGFDNNSNSKYATEISNFGGIIETNKDDKLIVSFKEKLVDKVDNAPHRAEQISLSIKEAVSSGKSNITINMYPKALGAIDIQIEFNMVGGKQVVESIKITAERRDTLDIIQKSEVELRKNLTEVTKSSEEASLEFDLNHNDSNDGKDSYFQNFEERQNWMNKFQQSTDKLIESNSVANYSDQNNYITEDSVNIIA